MQRTATIVQFRARDDITQLVHAIGIRHLVTTFKGTVLGTTADGFDVIAAFNCNEDAARFLERYLEDGMEGPIGTYIIQGEIE